MAKGKEIIVSAEPKGVFKEGTISGTPKPGTCMQLQAGTAAIGGRFTWEVFSAGADGDQRLVAILLADNMQGQLATSAYVSGTRGFLYIPVAGEEFNMLVADVAGTGDDHTIGELMMIDTGTGKLVTTTGSPEMESFILLEATTDPTADALLWAMYTGH